MRKDKEQIRLVNLLVKSFYEAVEEVGGYAELLKQEQKIMNKIYLENMAESKEAIGL